MADNSKIEWTDATWNPVTGCSVVSPGCTNCYAMKLAGTRLKHHPSRAGLTIDTRAGPVWNGEVRFNEQWLDQPLRWSKPRMIFVCAHGDLFAEGVTNAMLDSIFAVMALCPQHTFQVLTKRPKRMREYMDRSIGRIADSVMELRTTALAKRLGLGPNAIGPLPHITPGLAWWPLPNIWLGVSVEDQTRADQRIPDLLATPAAIRFISAEPLLGPINIMDAMWAGDEDPLTSLHATLDWVIVGGESGSGARPMHSDWARSIRDQCASANVPFFFKQWGAYLPAGQMMADGRTWAPLSGNNLHAAKSLAGRFLDGVEHNAMPNKRAG